VISQNNIWRVRKVTDRYSFSYGQDRQCTYNNTGARSCYHCCSGKAINNKYWLCVCVRVCVCVCVNLDIQHAMRNRHIDICGLSACNWFFHFILQMSWIYQTMYTVCSSSGRPFVHVVLYGLFFILKLRQKAI